MEKKKEETKPQNKITTKTSTPSKKEIVRREAKLVTYGFRWHLIASE